MKNQLIEVNTRYTDQPQPISHPLSWVTLSLFRRAHLIFWRNTSNMAALTQNILAAYIFGLILIPFAYIALGALGGFSPAFTLLTLPLLTISCGFLLYQYIWQKTLKNIRKIKLIGKLISWLLILSFLYLISNFTLQTRLEQIGLFASLYLSSSLLCLPFVLSRKTTLAKGLEHLPNWLTLSLILTISLLVTTTTCMYLVSTPKLF